MNASDLSSILQRHSVRVHKVLDDRISVYCPFHKGGQEQSASMSVYTDSGVAVCFTCGYKRNVARMLEELGMPSQAALDLKEEIKKIQPQQAFKPSIKQNQQLSSWAGAFRSYLPKNLLDLGYTEETLDHFHVGYDPRYQRVTYPLYNKHGELVAIIGGSIRPTTEMKYKLYDEEVGLPTGVRLDHRNHLWGYHLIKNTGPYVIVEGYKAAMWVHQAGIPVVATQGTQFTKAQVTLIVEDYRPVWILYDNDSAGQEATIKLATALIERMGTRVRVLEYPKPEIKQPDDMSADELLGLVERSKHV